MLSKSSIINDEYVMWKTALVAYLKVLLRGLRVETEENYDIQHTNKKHVC
jgi:hypothetical protein